MTMAHFFTSESDDIIRTFVIGRTILGVSRINMVIALETSAANLG